MKRSAVSPVLLALLAAAATAACDGSTSNSHGDIDLEGFRRGASELIARVESVRDRTDSFDPDQALAALRPPAEEGIRLDLALDTARAEPPFSAGGGSDDCASCWALEFEGHDPADVVSLLGTTAVESGRLVVEQQEGDYLRVAGEYALAADDIGVVEIRARHQRGTTLQLAWFRKPFDPEKLPEDAGALIDKMGVITVDTVPGAGFQAYRIDARTVMRRKVHGDMIRSLAIVPSNVAGDRVEIESVRVIPKRESYAQSSFGSAYETLGDELRPVVYVHTPQRLEWTLDVPSDRPELHGGVATLGSGSGVRFAISVKTHPAEAPAEEIWSRVVEDAETWSQFRVDLQRFAGQRISLALSADSEQPNIAFWSSPRVSARPSRRFNVIVLLEDTLRADRLSLYGHERPTSPEREQLAAGGVAFEAAFSQATKTRPSCPSLMTSLYPTATGVWFFNEALSERYITLAEILRTRGFETGAFIQNGNGGAVGGLHQGYDQLFNAGAVRDTPRLFEPALDWIEARADRNFFLYLHARDPHGAYNPPPPYDAWYRELGPGTKEVKRSRHKLDPEWMDQPTAEGRSLLYDGEILHNDGWIGRLVARLEELGIREDTLIVTLSDHGEHLGEYGRWGHRPPGHRWVIHVPLVLAYPRGLAGGVRVAHPVELVDVVPTILELAEIDASGLLLHGDSLLPLIEAPDSADWQDRLAVSEEVTGYETRGGDEPAAGSVFFRGLHVLDTKKKKPSGVYSYVSDPEERSRLPASDTKDLSSEANALLERLKSTNLETWRAIAGPESNVIRTDPDVREQLKALGYVE